MLFVLAAGRCAFPKCNELTASSCDDNENHIIGQIAHIIAHSEDGPRATPIVPGREIDQYGNWILLCPTHHTLVDKQPKKYPEHLLRQWKDQHSVDFNIPEILNASF